MCLVHLTPELSRAAKRRRFDELLGRISRPESGGARNPQPFPPSEVHADL